MKNIFRKSIGLQICILLLGFMFPNVSHGQNVIYDLAPFQSEYSLIRHYKDYVDITFSMYTCDEKGFYYIDRQNNITYRANLPCQFDVYDFRIFGDNVYFCGWKDGKTIIGWFDINDVFFFNGDIRILYFPSVTTIHDIDNGIDKFEYFQKLKVFKENGETHLVIVGNGKHIVNNIYGGGSIIVDVWTPDHIIWRFKYTMDYNNILNYEDIAVTDNYVVVTARDNSLQSNIFYYPLPTSAGMTIFDAYGTSPIAAPRYASDRNYLQCLTNLLVTEMMNDEFVTVCKGILGDGTQATVVTYYQDPVTWPLARYAYVPPTLPLCSYNEICYSKRNKKLYMPKYHADYIESFGAPFTQVDMYQIANSYMVMSLDTLDIKGDAVISATETGGPSTKKVWVLDEKNTENCVNVNNVWTWQEVEVRGYQPVNQLIYQGVLGEELLRPEIESIDMEIICE
ncbi:MAG: hypothetical protein IKR83_02770 [Bacteroidales bacterium]|nr:hypothetical protein [Bacteroidales bacterium]